MARPGPDPEQVARAWELHCEGQSLRHIGEALGIGHETARDWVGKAKHAEEYVGLLDREEARARQAVGLRVLETWLAEEYRAGGARAVEVGPVLVAAWRREAELLGLDAPRRMEIGPATQPAPDPKLVAAVRAAANRNLEKRRELEGSSADGE